MSKMISIRLPDKLYNDLKFITSNFPMLNVSQIIIMATTKDILRFKEFIDNGNK